MKIEIHEHDPNDYFTAALPVDYDPDAKCPTFKYLLESALPDPADQEMLQCFAGYCLIPDYRFQCVLFCYGPPNSGKSLLIYHGLGSVFGAELMSHVSLEKLCSGGDELRHLETSLVNIGTEINQRVLKDSDIFNKLASGEPLDAALKYERSRRIVPKCKYIFIGNHLPFWDRGSDAQARRIKILNFAQDFSDEPKDGSLERKVKEERNGIFLWMLTGLMKIIKMPQMPLGSERSQRCADIFKRHNNPIESFIRQCGELIADGWVTSKDFTRAVSAWCHQEDIKAPASITKQVLLNHPELRADRRSIGGQQVRCLIGIRLNEKGKQFAKAGSY